ncbi:aquaporin [Klebsiella pneumoniae]|uniref:Aquaporin n=1 Tax=Klebsiella pneumoniae TaxID=573 RepID=A0A2X3EXW6_KLEPN|nr:aquaporin [Klebsiella pneumoniae]
MFRKLAAECFGTFWLVFGGCGSAVLAAAFPELGIGFAGVALAFGLTVLTMAVCGRPYFRGAFQPGGHLRPVGRRPFSGKEVIGYIIAQVVGGIIAAAVLYVVASGKPALMPPPAASPPTAMANTPRAASPCCRLSSLKLS